MKNPKNPTAITRSRIDIFNATPRRVRLVGDGTAGGYPWDRRLARKHLQPDGVYHMTHLDAQAYHTLIRLAEVPGAQFNSVQFEEVGDGVKVPAADTIA